MTETRNHFAEFEHRKEQVVRFAERLRTLATTGGDAEAASVLQGFMGRFATNRFLLLVVGDFKSGKSTLVNALVGRPVCPVKATPRTAKVTRLSAVEGGDQEEVVEVTFRDDRPPERRSLDDGPLDELVAVNGRRTSEVALVDVYLKPRETILRNPVRLVDTPGIGSGEAEHSRVTREYLKHADAVLFVFSGTKPYSETERDFLLTFRPLLERTVFAVNRMDDVSDEDRKDVIEHIQASLVRDVLESGVAPPPVFPMSATRALAAMNAERREGLDDSGLPLLVEALEAQLAGALALNLLGNVAEQQIDVCDGVSDRAQLRLDALAAAAESVQTTKKPALEELRSDLPRIGGESGRVQQAMRRTEADVLAWSPERVQALRQDVVEAAREWIAQCPTEETCRKRLPGVVAKLIADYAELLDRELAARCKRAQGMADEGLRRVFESMEGRVRKFVARRGEGPAESRGGLGRRVAALSRISALANGVGGPTGGYGLASAAVASALGPSSTVQFLSVTAAVSLLIAAMGGPVGWLVAGVASLIAAIAGYNHATTWRERVLNHVIDGFDRQVTQNVADALEETIRTFFGGLVAEIEERSSAFLAQLEAILRDIEREMDRERRSCEDEAARLRAHVKELEGLRSELTDFVSKTPPAFTRIAGASTAKEGRQPHDAVGRRAVD